MRTEHKHEQFMLQASSSRSVHEKGFWIYKVSMFQNADPAQKTICSHVNWWPKAEFVMAKWSVWWARNVSIVCSPMRSRKSNIRGWKLGTATQPCGKSPETPESHCSKRHPFHPCPSFLYWYRVSKKSLFHCWKRMFGICDMQWWYVTQNRFLLRLIELYKWSGIIIIPKSKKTKVVGKLSHLRLSPLFQIKNPKNHQKTSKAPETVLKTNLCSLYFIIIQMFCAVKRWGRSLVVHLRVAKSGRSTRILTEDARSTLAGSSGSCHHQIVGIECLGKGVSAQQTRWDPNGNHVLEARVKWLPTCFT